MSLRDARDSSSGLARPGRASADPARRWPQRLDLGRSLGSAIGDDLLKDTHPSFQLGVARGILGGLFSGKPGVDFQLLLTEREKTSRQVHHQRRKADHDDQQAEYITRSHLGIP